MTSWLEYFLREDSGELVGVFAVFCLISAAFVWLLGMVLARSSLVVRRPLGIKVHVALSVSLASYSLVATAFLLRVAMEYKARGTSVLAVVPMFLPVAAALILVLSLSGKVGAEIAAARSKGRS